eukprot:899789-Rhodomonas_salina.4
MDLAVLIAPHPVSVPDITDRACLQAAKICLLWRTPRLVAEPGEGRSDFSAGRRLATGWDATLAFACSAMSRTWSVGIWQSANHAQIRRCKVTRQQQEGVGTWVLESSLKRLLEEDNLEILEVDCLIMLLDDYPAKISLLPLLPSASLHSQPFTLLCCDLLRRQPVSAFSDREQWP